MAAKRYEFYLALSLTSEHVLFIIWIFLVLSVYHVDI